MERLPSLLIQRPEEQGVVIHKQFEYFGSVSLFDLGELFGEADCSVHYTETRVVDHVDVGIAREEEPDE